MNWLLGSKSGPRFLSQNIRHREGVRRLPSWKLYDDLSYDHLDSLNDPEASCPDRFMKGLGSAGLERSGYAKSRSVESLLSIPYEGASLVLVRRKER